MNLEKIKQQLKKVQKQYDIEYENEGAMANDLLDVAEIIIRLKSQIINALESLNREHVREIEIDRMVLNTLECACNEGNDYTCRRCSRIWELNALLKGIELEKSKGAECDEEKAEGVE